MDDEPVIRPRPMGRQTEYMKQREANIEMNRAHAEELRDAFAALANMNSAGGSKKAAGGSKKVQEKLTTRKSNALGDRLVRVRRDLSIARTVQLTVAQSVEEHAQQQQEQAEVTHRETTQEADADTADSAENGVTNGVTRLPSRDSTAETPASPDTDANRLPDTDANPTPDIGPLGTGVDVNDNAASSDAEPEDAGSARSSGRVGVDQTRDVTTPADDVSKPADDNAVTGMDILSQIGDMQWPDWLRKYTAELMKVSGPAELTEIIRNLALLDMHLGFPSGQVSRSVT